LLGPVSSQTNFTSGILSPRLAGRTDLSKYHNGVSELNNFIILPQGGLYRRSGSRYVADVKDHSKVVRLVRFEFSVTQAYIIEFGDLYCRFYKDEGQIISGTPVEIVTTYTEADLFELKFAQSADTLYIAHSNYPPRKLTRSSHTAWTITTIAFTANPFSGAGDYPRCVTLYEERSVWAGTDNDPQKMFFSKSGDFEDMTTGTADSDAMVFTIANDQVNVILWLNPGDTLMVGTTGGEFEAHGSTPDQPITPTAVQINKQTNYGSANIAPLRISNQVLFVQRSQKKLLELSYQLEIDGFVAPDMTILSDSITRPAVKLITYQQHPDSTVWAVTTDGTLIAMTYYRPEDVVGWHRHPMGGEDVVVESVTTIPAPNGDHDQVWVSVKRTVDGNTVRYVEFFEEAFEDEDDLTDAFFVDSGLSYSGGAITSVSGLDHLEGETIQVVEDGAVATDKNVA